MKLVIVNGNPKENGLCHSVLEEILRGAKDGGAEVEVITPDGIERCHTCNGGWGSCRDARTCNWGDDGFTLAKEAVTGADAVCLITPVYWHEMAEGLKSLIDRLRRCERGDEGKLAGKPVLLVASAGGTGNGIINCMHQMEQFCRHTKADVFDFIGINRWNSDYKRAAAYAAAKEMAEGRKPGESL